MSFPSVPLGRIAISETTRGIIWYNGAMNPMTCTITCDYSETMEVLECSPASISDAKAALAQMYADPAWQLEYYDYA